VTETPKPATNKQNGTAWRRMRALVSRRPFISTALGGFSLGFIAVALWLLPGMVIKTESAVPSVVGLLYDDAAARLSAAGFKAKTGESLHHPTAPKSSVLAQNPAPGVKALKGNAITLDVSLGARKGTVPNVLGMTRDAATNALEDAGFDVPKEFTERLDSRPRGEVIAASPRVGATVLLPSTVRLTISAGPDAVGVPSLIGMPVEDALALLGQLGLTAGTTRTDSTSTQPDGFVSGQRPAANTPAALGTSVSLTVSRPRQPVPDSIP
jgi:eukaryotic-like serine/threonine-protein kinase